MIHSRDKLMQIYLDNNLIERCGYNLQEEGVKLLGIILDENLDWKLHVRHVTKKISKGNYLLWRHSKKLNPDTKMLIYNCFVRCHLLYGLVAWGGAKNVVTNTLVRTLKKVWSKIGKKFMHTNNRLEKFSILKFQDEVVAQESKILWHWNKKTLPRSLNGIIIERRSNLRGRRFDTSNQKIGSIAYRLSKRACKDLGYIATFKTIKTFTKNIKLKLLSQYRFSCMARNCFICVQR